MFPNKDSNFRKQKIRKRSNSSLSNLYLFNDKGISQQNFLQRTGFIGDKPIQQVCYDFMLIKNLIDKFKIQETSSNFSESNFRHTDRQENHVKIGPVIFKPDKGDWQCPKPECSNWNFSKRIQCNMCNQPKNQDFLQKSKNQLQSVSQQQQQTSFSQKRSKNQQNIIDHEWICDNCGFSNLGKRNECYKCKFIKK